MRAVEKVVLQTYVLQLVGPDHGREFTGISPFIIREAEENMSDLLPPNYSVVIRGWDEANESWRSGLWRNTR